MPALPDDRRRAAAAAEQEEEEDDEAELEYMLGFVEPPQRPTDLLRHRFPSKVGGRPAWLDPVNLPTREQLTCGVTGQAMRFLLQVYCPVDANPQDAFHRTVYLFVSPRGEDLHKRGAVRALRCQLPRSNPFYSDAPPGDGDLAPPPLPAAQQQLSLELDPWQAVAAEEAAAAVDGGAACAACGPALFSEHELVVEPEPEEGGEDDEAAAGAEVQRLLSAYQARVAAEGEYDAGELPADLVDELEGAAGPAQRAFVAFQTRTARAPEQCLRYCFQPGAAPLWPSHTRTPRASDVPPCQHCGAARQFEFQVMPQLLSFMDLDPEDPHAPDWGSVAVYSCPASCSAPPAQGGAAHSAYVEEFVWVQPS